MCPKLFLKRKFFRIIGLKFIDNEILHSVNFIQTNFHKIYEKVSVSDKKGVTLRAYRGVPGKKVPQSPTNHSYEVISF